MAGFSTMTNEHLIRSNLWSTKLKETLLDELFFTKYVDWINTSGPIKISLYAGITLSPSPYLGTVEWIGQSAGKKHNEQYNISLACRYNGR